MNEPASHGDGRPLAANVEEPMSPKATEPTSAQQLPSLPPAQGSGQSIPFHVAIADSGLEIAARIKNERDADNLIQVLQSIKPLLHQIYGRQPGALADPPDDHAERVFKASMTPDEAKTGMSFFITKAQKAELRRLGYSEEQIREMKPEDAHRALRLIS
jgi:hypothetical protein